MSPLSPEKQELLELEKDGSYLFHGSPVANIETFEPRQSTTISPETGQSIPDGDPAVAASPYAEIAIFKAIIQYGRSGFDGNHPDTLNFRATKKTLDENKNNGFVYVFTREKFRPRWDHVSDFEWRSKQPVKPYMVIEVKPADLPKNIMILPIENDNDR